MIILSILGYILAALIILITLVLIVPFEFYLNAQKKEAASITAKLSLIYGLFSLHFTKRYSQQPKICIRIFGLRKIIRMDKNNKSKKRRKQKPKEQDDFRNYLDADYLKSVLSSIKKVLSHIKVKKFGIEGRLGLDDPYITGIVCALLNVLSTEPKFKNFKINMVFDDEVIEGKGIIQGRGVLAYIIYIALKLYLSRPDKINQKPKFKEVKING